VPASQQNVAEIGLNVLECPWKVLEFIFLPNLWPPCAVDWGSRLLRGHLVDQEQTGRVWWLKPAEDGTRLERSQGSVSRQSTLEISFSSTHPSECHSLNQGLVQWFCRYIYVLQTPSFEGIDTRKSYSCDCFCWLCWPFGFLVQGSSCCHTDWGQKHWRHVEFRWISRHRSEVAWVILHCVSVDNSSI